MLWAYKSARFNNSTVKKQQEKSLRTAQNTYTHRKFIRPNARLHAVLTLSPSAGPNPECATSCNSGNNQNPNPGGVHPCFYTPEQASGPTQVNFVLRARQSCFMKPYVMQLLLRFLHRL